MLMIIFLFIFVLALAYLIRSPKMILFMMLIFLGVISLLTPFWPFLVIGLVMFYQTNKKRTEEELAKKKYEYEEYKHRENLYKRKENI